MAHDAARVELHPLPKVAGHVGRTRRRLRLSHILLAVAAAACARSDDGSALDGPVRVTYDDLGVPHVSASTSHDVFYAQGWLAAHQRLFQMDLTRRRAQGRRAELLGEERYKSDLQSRALGFARWGERSAAWLAARDPETYAVFEAYAAGVDRYLADAAAGVNGASLPPQIEAIGYTPEPWTVADSLAIEKMLAAGLSMRPDQEVTLGLLWLLLGEDRFEDLYRYAPYDRDYTFLPGGGLPEDVPAAASVRLPPSEQLAEARAALVGHDLSGLSQALIDLDLARGGSNNWAVAPTHMASGHAVLAGDTHQGVGHPAVYWLVHLRNESAADGFDVVGASFPGVPLVMFGHNGHAAWTPTTSLLDVADAWLETWVEEGRSVERGEGVVEVDSFDEVVRVRRPDGTVEDRPTTLYEVPGHGPILPAAALDLPLPLTISLGWTGYRPESIAPTYLAFARARSFADLREGLSSYHAGGMNWVYADVDGHIGWSNRVDVPTRDVLDATSPPWTLLPSDGLHEWTRGADDAPYLPLAEDAFPHLLDPSEGWITTANNDPYGATDDGDPLDDAPYLSAIYDIGTRSYQPKRRLRDATAGDAKLSFEQVRDLQLDTTSRLAETLLPYLRDAATRRPDLVDADAAALLARLDGWDAACGVDAVEPTVFHLWLALAARGVMADEGAGVAGTLGDLVFEDLSYQLGLVAVKFLRHWLDATADDLDAIEAGTVPFPSSTGRNVFDDARTADRVETRDEVLLAALAAVPAEAARIFGTSDPAAWRWGDWHRLVLADPAESYLPGAGDPGRPKAGGLYTVDVGDYSWFVDGVIPEQLAVTNAPSNRFATELVPGAVRFEVALPGGQSERPGDPHHLDLLDDYLDGRYRALELDPVAVTELDVGW